jgi:hypothetical protein
MSTVFSQTEKNFKSLCREGNEFNYEGSRYKIIKSGKPSPTDRGECKTDVYILSEDILTKELKEFKISIKQSNADFLENKISLERAKQLFGSNTSFVLTNSIKQIYSSFINDEWVLLDKKGRTEEKTIKIGWKFEICNKKQGEKSELLLLSDEQKIDVYSGTNLSEGKKNSTVNGVVINNSGISNYVLVIDEVTTVQKSLDSFFEDLKPIEEYAVNQNLYFACKAINYRVQKSKWDGDRPLAVFINWYLIDNIIHGQLIIENPLSTKANLIGNNLKEILNQININKDNFDKIIPLLSKDIKYFKN